MRAAFASSRVAVAAALSLCLALAITPATAQPPAPIMFFDLAGPDSAKLPEFYAKVFGWTRDTAGNLSVPTASPLGGTIRAGDPTEKRIYIGVPDVAATLAAVEANGGTVDAPRFAVPGAVILGLFRDPAGNPMGLVETQDGKAKVP
jgi:predicted enzyme related to lactoylglutathione lyase